MSETELREGMRVLWDVAIPMDDGIVLRADVFLPEGEGRYPVLLTYGPYAKGLAFQEGYPSAWQRMVERHPDVAANSSNIHANWEVVDPREMGPPRLRLRPRRQPRLRPLPPAYVDHFSPRETQDFYDCIEWAGVQAWSNGRVGLNGISYYGINQWQVASRQPPHLTAMCIWEGAADWYRDMTHHGGIVSTFWANWYDMQVKTVQYGLGERGPPQPPQPVTWSAAPKPSAKNNSPPTAATLAPTSAPIRWTTTITAPAPPTGRRSRCRSSPPPTGAGRGSTPAETSKDTCARHRSINGSKLTVSSTGLTFTQRLRPHPAAPLLRPVPQGRA